MRSKWDTSDLIKKTSKWDHNENVIIIFVFFLFKIKKYSQYFLIIFSNISQIFLSNISSKIISCDILVISIEIFTWAGFEKLKSKKFITILAYLLYYIVKLALKIHRKLEKNEFEFITINLGSKKAWL